MMIDKDGGPAFPVPAPVYDERTGYEHADGGMTLRDYFAAAELSKVFACNVCDIPEAYERQAEHCYRMADAMLKEREK